MRSTLLRIACSPRWRNRTRLTFLACLGPWVTGCGGDSGPAGPGGSVDPVVVSGAVQKGPFILGAQVQVNVLDSVGNPTGTVFNTTTTSDKGEFSVSVSPSVVDLVTDGFYYNEGTWGLSGAAISMRALTEITASGPQTAYVNVLTHMAQRRALNLFSGGTALDSAVAQAEGEVRGIFPNLVPPSSLVSGSDMNLLGGDTPSNAYLLGLSCVVSQTALIMSDGTDNDAQLQQLINSIASDLEADGVAGQVGLGGSFDPYECVASLQERLDNLGDATTVLPDPQQVLDWDADGDPNSTDPDSDGDGVNATDDPVVSLAVTATQLLVVLRDSGRGLQLINPPPPPAVGALRYGPGLVGDPGGVLTDVVEAIAALGVIVIRRGDGTVHFLRDGDNQAAQPVTGIASAAVSMAVTTSGVLLVIDANGNVTRHATFDSCCPPSSLSMTNVARIAGVDPNYVYLDNVGDVRIAEGVTVTDVLGLAGVTITDVAADQGASAGGYIAISDTGALYRFRSAAPTAVEDIGITGVNSLHISTTAPPPGATGGSLFAVTTSGVWDLSEGGGPFQVSDVAGLTSFYGPVTWGESGIYAYVATDTAGNVQLIDFTGDLSTNGLFRQVYVPR